MFVGFLYELRARGVPVGAQEALNLAQALSAGLHESSLEGFYDVARALCVHSEKHLDDFDQAFAKHFKGVEVEAKKLKDELWKWLEEARESPRELTPEERALLEQYGLDELKKLFEERMNEQDERHDGGKKWIGTGGASPFGNSGAARPGIRAGGKGGNRSAIQVAGERRYQSYRDDVTLDVRQMAVALRKLRMLTREGGELELDLDGTIDETAKNAGELEIVMRPPRRPNTRVILLMDIGGSMDPYAHLVSRLFTAASKSTHFKELRCYYFHNCVYGKIYSDAQFTQPVKVRDLLADCGSHHKLIMVGDALMAPYELLQAGGSIDYEEDNPVEGIVWLMRLREHFDKSCWLNPEPEKYWHGNTIEYVRKVFDMFPLTVDGLGEAVQHLTKGKSKRTR
ncbi:MAG: VWA domain-containing protein [Sandaracinaceae bacterium]|nr:VWA domain-containing protein [Sandaracinaceae bacterium]